MERPSAASQRERDTARGASFAGAIASEADPRAVRRLNVATAAVLGSVALALVLGAAARWICDDAFISFRYARNLVEGQGLVFNQGEYVEGITNLGWTLLCALGIALGFPAGDFAVAVGLLAHVGVVTTLGVWSIARLRSATVPLDRLTSSHARHEPATAAASEHANGSDAARSGAPFRASPPSGLTLGGLATIELWTAMLPIAALTYALHPQTAVWATGGLETSLLTLCWTLAAVLLLWPQTPRSASFSAGDPDLERSVRRRHWFAAGFAALALTLRPDAIVIGLGLCLWPLATLPRAPVSRLAKDGARLLVPTLLVALALLVFRVSYYGELVPNTYYAKSAHLAWWSQGGCYIGSFLEQSGPLYALVFAALAWASVGQRAAPQRAPQDSVSAPGLAQRSQALPGKPDADGERELAGAWILLLCVTLYGLAIARVGGDFMYARMLAPTLPLIAIVAQLAIGARVGGAAPSRRQHRLRFAVVIAWLGVLVLTGLLKTPVGTTPETWRCGIADEWGYYSEEHQEKVERRAQITAELISGLPIRVAIVGSQAQDAFLARIPTAIEAETGLCDRSIARQPLKARGRVGHEKQADPHYLLVDRKAQLVFGAPAFERLGLDSWIPRVPVFKDGLDAYLLAWDEELVSQLRERGAQVAPFPEMLDEFLRGAEQLDAGQLRAAYLQSWWFYFRVIQDRPRHRRFIELLEAKGLDSSALAGVRPS